MRCRATSVCSETSTLQPLLLKKSLQKDYRRHPSFTGKSTPLPANARFLERPQGAQRSLLRCGETPDAGDIEELVGSIPPQRLQRLAIVQVPGHNQVSLRACKKNQAARA